MRFKYWSASEDELWLALWETETQIRSQDLPKLRRLTVTSLRRKPAWNQTNSPVEREKLLDALAEYEWRLRLAWNQGDQRLPIDPAPLTQIQDSLKSDETLLEYRVFSQ